MDVVGNQMIVTTTL